ncbi:PucR family transcriptional regulator [Nocardia sp. NPDC059764]|uniref:PucR family transcriptional regulator n=1 Tax=Nocardia sp. NPDC059764 TaxID=3346939 RepID=UPI00364BFD8A
MLVPHRCAASGSFVEKGGGRVLDRGKTSHILTAVAEPLSDRLPGIAGGLSERILAEDAAYAALIAPVELRDTILRNLRQTVASMLDRSEDRPVDLSDATWTGRTRATQGLPLSSLQDAYRRGCRLLWEAMIETVAERDPASLPDLLPCVGDLWDIVDLLIGAVTDAYQAMESERLARDGERRNAVLDVLLGGPGAVFPAGGGAGLVAQASAVLGLPERARYAVAAVRSVGGASLPRDRGRPATDGFHILWRIRADHEVGLIALGGDPLTEPARLLREQGVAAGISPVVGSLAELARARWLAEIALQTGAPDAQVVVLDQRLPAALVAAQSELAERLRTVVLGPLLRLPAAERDVLLATVTAWLDAGGSAAGAGAALYCHRNTVLNRLRRIEELTGRSIAEPRAMIELALAVEAARR